MHLGLAFNDRCADDGTYSHMRGALTGMGLIGRLRGRLEVLWSARATMLLSVLIVAGIGATAGLLIWHERQSALEEHEHEMNSIGVVLSEQTSRYAQVIDLILRQVQSRIALLNVATPEDFQQQLAPRRFAATCRASDECPTGRCHRPDRRAWSFAKLVTGFARPGRGCDRSRLLQLFQGA